MSTPLSASAGVIAAPSGDDGAGRNRKRTKDEAIRKRADNEVQKMSVQGSRSTLSRSSITSSSGSLNSGSGSKLNTNITDDNMDDSTPVASSGVAAQQTKPSLTEEPGEPVTSFPGPLSMPPTPKPQQQQQQQRGRANSNVASSSSRTRTSQAKNASSMASSSATPPAAAALSSQVVPGTVAALRPSVPHTIMLSDSVYHAGIVMAANRCDALLVIDERDALCGIVTDKDIAFRAIAKGLEYNTTKVEDIMTRAVTFVNGNQTAKDALELMIGGGFRHLPVIGNSGEIIGLLDITRCMYQALRIIEQLCGTSAEVSRVLSTLPDELRGLTEQLETIRKMTLLPNVGTLCDQFNNENSPTSKMPPMIAGRNTSVLESTKIMASLGATAVLVHGASSASLSTTENNAVLPQIDGIFTTKDVVLRVVAARCDPRSTSVLRVMTPKPDTLLCTASVSEALRMMHERRYMHLPIVDRSGRPVGLLNVLSLAYSVISKINALTERPGAFDGTDFWTGAGAGAGAGTASMETPGYTCSTSSCSGDDLQMFPRPYPHTAHNSFNDPMYDVGDSVSVTGTAEMYAAASAAAAANTPSSSVYAASSFGTGYKAVAPGDANNGEAFVFKFRIPGTKRHCRVLSPPRLGVLRALVWQKLAESMNVPADSYDCENDGSDDRARSLKEGGGTKVPASLSLCYADEEGDSIVMHTDADVVAAVQVARELDMRRVALIVSYEAPGDHGDHSSNRNVVSYDNQMPLLAPRKEPMVRQSDAEERAKPRRADTVSEQKMGEVLSTTTQCIVAGAAVATLATVAVIGVRLLHIWQK